MRRTLPLLRGLPMVDMMVREPIHRLFVVIALAMAYITYKEQMAALSYPEIKPPNPERKLVHMVLGFMPILYFLPISFWATQVAWIIGFLLAWSRQPRVLWRKLLWEPPEPGAPRVPDVGILAFPTVMLWCSLFLMASGHTMLLTMLAFGDGAASLVGQRTGGPSLPWNRQKTWAGWLAFVLVGGAMSWLVCAVVEYSGAGTYWGKITFGGSLWWIMAAALATVESLPLATDDNIRIGVAFLFLWGMFQ